MSKSERVTRSLKINPQLWKELKLHCVKKDIEISSFIEQVIREKLNQAK